MKLKTFIALLVATAVSGCASVMESYSQDGRKAYALNCSGTARGWDKCFSKAGEICKEAGYDVLDRTGETTAQIGGNRHGFYGSQGSERSMVVACKAR